MSVVTPIGADAGLADEKERGPDRVPGLCLTKGLSGESQSPDINMA